MTYAGVASLGDTTEPSAIAGGVLAGHEADVGHELARALEAPEIAKLGGDDHRGLSLEAAEAAETVDERLIARRKGEPMDAVVEFIPALELVLEEGQVLGGTVRSSSARVSGWSTWRIQLRWRTVQCVPSR
jgi:hypothetical protein